MLETVAWLALRIVFAWMFLHPVKALLEDWSGTVQTTGLLFARGSAFFAAASIAMMVGGGLALLFGVYGEHEHLGVETQRYDPARCLQPIRSRHRQVHDDDVRSELTGAIYSLVTTRSLPYHRDPTIRLEQGLDTRAKHGVVIDEQNGQAFHHALATFPLGECDADPGSPTGGRLDLQVSPKHRGALLHAQ